LPERSGSMIIMPNAQMNPERWRKMLDLFRQRPGVYGPVARACKSSQKTAKKAWLHGWPELNLRPIRDVLAEEQKAVRAAAAGIQAAVGKTDPATSMAAIESAARDGSIGIRALEAVGIRSAITAGNDLLEAFAEIAAGIKPLAGRVRAKLQRLAAKAELGEAEVDVEAVVGLITDFAVAGQRLAGAYQTGMQMERLRAGDPTEIIEERGTYDVEEAIRRLELGARAAERAKERLAKERAKAEA